MPLASSDGEPFYFGWANLARFVGIEGPNEQQGHGPRTIGSDTIPLPALQAGVEQ